MGEEFNEIGEGEGAYSLCISYRILMASLLILIRKIPNLDLTME